MTVKTHKRLEELRVLLNFEEHNGLFAMFSNGYKQAEIDMAMYKSACDVMMNGLIFLKERTGDSACTWRCDISAGKTIAEAKRIIGEP